MFRWFINTFYVLSNIDRILYNFPLLQTRLPELSSAVDNLFCWNGENRVSSIPYSGDVSILPRPRATCIMMSHFQWHFSFRSDDWILKSVNSINHGQKIEVSNFSSHLIHLYGLGRLVIYILRYFYKKVIYIY